MPCVGCDDKTKPIKAEKVSQWHMIETEPARKLDREIRRWIGTPYKSKARVKGGGVDCRNLVAAILDAWSNAEQHTYMPPMPQDSGIHSVKAGFVTVRAIRRVYDSIIVRDGTLEPGDILVVSGENPKAAERLGHVMMMTTRKNVAVHATRQGGVSLVGIGQFNILRNYRAKDKNQWF